MLTKLEQRLTAVGYSALDLVEKNNLIQELARKAGKPFNEITEDYILKYHKQIKLSAMTVACETTIVKGFTASNGHFYRTDRDDQINFFGQKEELNDDPALSTVQWKTEDAGYVLHTREEWIKVYKEAHQHKKGILYKYNVLKMQVAAAQSHEDILAVAWDNPLD